MGLNKHKHVRLARIASNVEMEKMTGFECLCRLSHSDWDTACIEAIGAYVGCCWLRLWPMYYLHDHSDRRWFLLSDEDGSGRALSNGNADIWLII